MKVKVIYFTQTQNTKLIADAVVQGLKDKGAEVSLINWMDVRRRPIEEVVGECDLLGIGYPCFYYKAPFCIEEWVQKFPVVKDRPYFQFSAYGGILGATFRRTDNFIRKKGWVLLDWGAFLSWGSFQLFDTFPSMAVQYPDELELAKVRQFGQFQVIKHAIYQAGRRNFLRRPERGEWYWYKKSYLLTKKVVNKKFPLFELDKAKCTQCRQCVDNCPDDTISLDQGGYPVFHGNCTRCYFCAKMCPTGAIANDWTELRNGVAKINWSHFPDWLKYWPDFKHFWKKHPNHRLKD